jgi:hypothetical protein
MRYYLMMMFVCLSVCNLVCARADSQQQPNSERDLRNTMPVWEQYLSASQKFKLRGDGERAKQYLLEALTQLEKPHAGSTQFNGRRARLETAILALYPKYPKDSPPGVGPQQIKLDEEEIAVLTRLNRINRGCPARSPLMSDVIETQIRFAKADLDKNKLDGKAKTKQE